MTAPAEPPPLRLALAGFGSALVFVLAGSIGLIGVAPDLAAGWFPLPRVVAVVHLFTLGWITLSILAALHYFVPVALHTSLMPEPAAWVQLAAFDLGLTVFTAGELFGLPSAIVAGASVLALALLAYALGLAAAMLRARPRGRTARALLAAALFLVVTLTLGELLAGGRAFGWLGGRQLPVLSLHVRLALMGWVLLVLAAVGQRLLPMFLLAPAPGARLAAASLTLVAAGALALLPCYGRTGRAAWLPLLAGAAGLALFLGQAAATFRRSTQARIDPGLRLAGAGLALLALALLLVVYSAAAGASAPPVVLLVAAVLLALTLVIAGHYYRLVPFLVWSSRWARVRDGQAAPRSPANLYRDDAASASLILLAAGAGTLLVAVGFRVGSVAAAGALVFALGTAIMAWQMARTMASRPH